MKRLLKYIKGYEVQSILSPLFKLFEALMDLFVPIVVAGIIDNGIACLFAASIKCQVQSLSRHSLKKQNEQEILILLNYCKPHIEGWCTSFVNVVI